MTVVVEDTYDEDDILAELEELLTDDQDDEPEEERLQEEAESKYAKRDDKTRKAVKVLAEKIAKDDADEQVEKLLSEFDAEASVFAKDFMAIQRTGRETPAQVKKLIETAKQRESEWLKKTSPEDEDEETPDEDVEQKAEEIAKKQWGTAPISGAVKSDDTKQNELLQRISRGGDEGLKAYIEATQTPIPTPR